MSSEELLIKNFINLLWGEFNEIRKSHHIAPLILSFSIIEACAKLSVPEDLNGPNKTRKRFEWWVDKFLRDKKGNKYESIDLYGARCGLFHEYGIESDLSRGGKCKLIAWVIGQRESHKNQNEKMILYSREEFFDDLYDAGIRMLEELKIDLQMNLNFVKRLPKIFGVTEIGS
jgi:hypothetical protein